MYMISTTGRIPASAAPRAMPINACSEMGVSSTRSGPNSSKRLRAGSEKPSVTAHVFAKDKHTGVTAQLFAHGLVDRLDVSSSSHTLLFYSTKTSVYAMARSGKGLSSAKRTASCI